jgi:hypothetical protein
MREVSQPDSACGAAGLACPAPAGHPAADVLALTPVLEPLTNLTQGPRHRTMLWLAMWTRSTPCAASWRSTATSAAWQRGSSAPR